MNNILYVGKHALTWTVSRHIHQSWELIFCTGGSGEMIFDGRTLEYGVNDVAVVPPMVPHSNASREGFTNIHMNLTDPALTYTEPLIIRADSNGFLRDAFTAAFYYWSDTSAEYTLLPLYGQLIVAYLTKYRSVRRHSETVQQIEDNILQHYPDCTYDLNAYLGSLPEKDVQKGNRPHAPPVPDRPAAGERRKHPVHLLGKGEHLGDRPHVRLCRPAVLLPAVQEEVRRLPPQLHPGNRPGPCRAGRGENHGVSRLTSV